MVIQNLDGLVQPAEVEETLSWFQARPGKLCQAHGVNAGLLHEFGINWPALSTPMFRVIIGAEERLIHHQHLVLSPSVVQYTVNYALAVSLAVAVERRMTRWYELFVGNQGRRCRFIAHMADLSALHLPSARTPATFSYTRMTSSSFGKLKLYISVPGC